MKLTSTHTMIAAAVLALLLLPVAAPAQTDAQLGDLQRAIERNQELLGRAIQLVSETASTKARTSLQAAVKLHELSKQLAQAGDNPGAAVRATARARQAILNTIEMAIRAYDP